ncbi:MAG: hypothetical protein K7J46_19355 [Bryobacter sp.]|jgi:hypothetical protein|nr:hypothetical protein [Bryobacter sp. CoA8 C33]
MDSVSPTIEAVLHPSFSLLFRALLAIQTIRIFLLSLWGLFVCLAGLWGGPHEAALFTGFLLLVWPWLALSLCVRGLFRFHALGEPLRFLFHADSFEVIREGARSRHDYRLNTSLYHRFGLLLWRQQQAFWFLPAASPNINQISARLQSI